VRRARLRNLAGTQCAHLQRPVLRQWPRCEELLPRAGLTSGVCGSGAVGMVLAALFVGRPSRVARPRAYQDMRRAVPAKQIILTARNCAGCDPTQETSEAERQAPFLVAMLIKMLLTRFQISLLDVFGDAGVLGQVILLIDTDRERHSPLEVAVVDEMVLR
jgi:hypothetical protein